nr:WcbI family polysaccharide biosynthesis putative acetyltransferase [Methylobacterium brachythecii]
MTFSIPSWATPWRSPAPAPERRGPKIAVIGNCQAEGVAQVLQLLMPDAQVELQLIAHLQRRFGDHDGLAQHLRDSDFVFSHFFWLASFPGGNTIDLQRKLPRLRMFPVVVFPAFHPDMIYVGDIASLRLSALVHGPLGPSHSAIALFGFLEGLSVEATLGLYTGAVFERLGYHRAWDEGAAHLLGAAREVGFGLEAEFVRWQRRGCFMHDSNHPKLHVLADIATRLAVEAGLQPLDLAAEEYLPDLLVEEALWPVYPAIASHYGVSAQDMFRAKTAKGRPPRLYDLKSFVAESFARYAQVPREQLRADRIEAWRGDPGIRALFRSAGGA